MRLVALRVHAKKIRHIFRPWYILAQHLLFHFSFLRAFLPLKLPSTLNHFRNKFDLVSIDPGESYGEYCDPLADFPRSGTSSSGGFAHGKIVTCGGDFSGSGSSKRCYYYSGNKWVHFGDLTDEKKDHGKFNKMNFSVHFKGLLATIYLIFCACR